LHRFWDTATYWLKIAYFCYPSLIRRPLSLCWNFAVKLTVRKLESWGYNTVKTPWSYLKLCHDTRLWRTDRRTKCVIANTALCIASYAGAVKLTKYIRMSMCYTFVPFMFGKTGFLTAINCFDVKLSARGQSTMTLTSIATLIIISITGVIWSITGKLQNLLPQNGLHRKEWSYKTGDV